LKPPLVSVIIPTYNRKALIADAIYSVITQTYDNWELIIVDDNSTDNTKGLVEKCLKSDDRIRYAVNKRKKGPSGARNTGIAQAAGKYIAFLDSDDVWLPHHLNDCVNVLENNTIEICFTLWLEQRGSRLFGIDDDPSFTNAFDAAIKTLKPRMSNGLVFFKRGMIEYIILNGFYFYHINTMLIKRDVFNTVGLFHENMYCAEDMDFVFRIFNRYDFCLIHDYHFIYREGFDNIYKFTDRRSISVKNLVNDKGLVNKFTVAGKNDILMKKNLKKLIKTFNVIEDKKKCINVVNNLISRKYFTLGIINTNYHKIISVWFLTASLVYQFKIRTIMYILRVLFKGYNAKTNIKSTDLDLL
jgi:glycosyltransferase involved in cell wall biosynthesis